MKETCGVGRYLGGWMYMLGASQFTDSGGYGFRLFLYKTGGHGRCMILAPIKTTCNSIQHPTTRDLSTLYKPYHPWLSSFVLLDASIRDACIGHMIAVKPGNFRPSRLAARQRILFVFPAIVVHSHAPNGRYDPLSGNVYST